MLLGDPEMVKHSVGPFKVFEVKQKDGVFYSACLSAKDLTSITYSDVRRLVTEERDVERYLGVQRPINLMRVKRVRDYILSPDATFPTAIIIAVDEDAVDYNEHTGEMVLHVRHVDANTGEGKEIPFGKIAKVLDGQHRLAGFFNQAGDFDINGAEFDLNVSIFVGADLSVQAQIFATVNLAQTKVSKSLVYELEDLSEIRSPFKVCHNIAVALDGLSSSPFYKRIKRLGMVTPGRSGETITQAAFVEALVTLISRDPFADRNIMLEGGRLYPVDTTELSKVPFRNMFIQEKDFEIADNIVNYFTAVREKWPNAWGDTSRKSGILPKTNAFRAFMRHLRDVYPRLSYNAGSSVVSVAEYANILRGISLDDDDLTTRNFKPGSSGEAAFYKVLTGVTPADDLFEQMPLPLD